MNNVLSSTQTKSTSKELDLASTITTNQKKRRKEFKENHKEGVNNCT